MSNDKPEASAGAQPLGRALREELREIAWLVSVIGVLSAAGVGLAVALAAA